MPESTPAQHLYGTSYGGFGVEGFGYGGFKTPAGVTLLPPVAAVRAPGAFEGRSAYDGAQYGVWGVGGFSSLGIHAGSYATYRLMRAHPTLALARATIRGPIEAAGTSIESDDDAAPAGARELIETHVLPMRRAIVAAALFALDYGFQTAELVFDGSADGDTIVEKFKPLIPELTTFETDKQGNVLFVVNGGVKLPPGRFFHFVNDAEGGNPYGRSRFENCRRTWGSYLDKEDQAKRLGDKVSGIQVHVGYPPDNEPLAAIQARGDVTNAVKAAQMARDLRDGKSIAFPSLAGLRTDNIEQAIALSKGTLWPITLLDMGNAAPSQASNIEDRKYLDQQLCRGMLRSERSVIEAQGGGTRAESADHTANISDTDCDAIHEAIVEAINRQIVDPMLVENYGEAARGTVRLVANQIVDETRVILLKLLDAWINDPSLFAELMERADKNLIVDKLGIKLNKDAEAWPEEMPSTAAPSNRTPPNDDPDAPDGDE